MSLIQIVEYCGDNFASGAETHYILESVIGVIVKNENKSIGTSSVSKSIILSYCLKTLMKLIRDAVYTCLIKVFASWRIKKKIIKNHLMNA